MGTLLAVVASLSLFSFGGPPPASDEALSQLGADQRKLVESHAPHFLRASDGTYWDRQILFRQRETAEKITAPKATQPPMDDVRALGLDPETGTVRGHYSSRYR